MNINGMNRMERKMFIALAMFVMLFASCGGDKPGSPEAESFNNLITGSVKTTSFTVSVTGSFSGISKVDLALGKNGVLYCEKTANAEDIFKSWKDGNDNPECIVFNKGKLSGETYSGVITGLKPDTEYSFCLFSQNKDNTSREISAVQTIRTQAFNPGISEVRMDSVHYFDAVAKGSVTIEEADAACCEIGILLSDTENGSPANSLSLPYNGSNLDNIRIRLSELIPGSTYYCRLYVKYPSAPDKSDYKLGQEKALNTKDLLETAVNLGLPSGILWAECDLGDNEPISSFYYTTYYQWGAHSYFKRPDSNTTVSDEWAKTHYEHWNAQSGSYVDIGQEISGGSHDAVHLMLGGKWRMPSKADVEELIANCTVSNWEIGYGRYVGHIEGASGSVLKIEMNRYHWCGTEQDNDNALVFYYNADYINGNYRDGYKAGTGRIEFKPITKHQWYNIRPVWDPNMPD